MIRTTLVLVSLFAVTGCKNQGLTRQEADDAVAEMQVASQASALTSASIEVSTDFTIGQGVADTAMQIRDFVHSQLPCAEITVSAGRLEIEYGANPGVCTFRGQTFHGSHVIEVMRNESNDVIVNHTWTAFGNNTIEISGTAMVTWSTSDPSRHVVYSGTWKRLADGSTGTAEGDRIQRPLDGSLITGMTDDGDLSWTTSRGTWSLDIDEVHMRWIDPVPHSGGYTLTTPADKVLSVRFARKNATTITVTLTSGRTTFNVDVITLP